jgi:hypothetical protein
MSPSDDANVAFWPIDWTLCGSHCYALRANKDAISATSVAGSLLSPPMIGSRQPPISKPLTTCSIDTPPFNVGGKPVGSS